MEYYNIWWMIYFQTIYIQSSGLSAIHDCAFHGLDLRILLINPKALNVNPSLELSGQNLHEFGINCFRVCPIQISHDICKGCKVMRNVSLIACNLFSVPNLEYVSNTLETLRLVANNIISLSTMYHMNFIKLKYLDLYKNHLPQVNAELLYFPQIIAINLDSNFLFHIDLRFSNWRQGQTDIYLPQNTWNWSKNWDWLSDVCLRNETEQYTWHSNNSSKLIFNGLDQVSCQYPEERKGATLIPYNILKSDITSCHFGYVSFGMVKHPFQSSIIIIMITSFLNFKVLVWSISRMLTDMTK